MRTLDSPADPRLIDLSALDAEDELDTISLLDLEPDWREAIPERDLETARQLLRVRVVGLRARSWQPPVHDSAAYGFLIADGLLLRRLRVGGAVSVELLGPGDLVRPGSPESRDGMVPPVIEWRALSPLRLAFLDPRITRLAGHWPALGLALSDRLIRRAHRGGYLMAVRNFMHVPDRLLAALWHMAFHWGRVTTEGTMLPCRLTHELIAEIVGARRPSITLALGELERAGRLARRTDHRIVLLGDPPDFTQDAAGAVLARD